MSPERPVTPEEDVLEYIDKVAKDKNLNASLMKNVIDCESEFNPRAVGDGGDSLGLVQINMPSHKYISPEQAYNPHFAIDFMADMWSKGHADAWTCYRQLTPV